MGKKSRKKKELFGRTPWGTETDTQEKLQFPPYLAALFELWESDFSCVCSSLIVHLLKSLKTEVCYKDSPTISFVVICHYYLIPLRNDDCISFSFSDLQNKTWFKNKS